MIPKIGNTILRRVAIVLTIIGIVVCLGPLALIRATLQWIEREFDVDLRDAWEGKFK
jgi:hypothetical protein